jgi:hypothetical protein
MKYTASMFLNKDDIMIFAINLGEFATCDEAKSVIEKHKETIELLDYHMKAEYTVFKLKDDNDDNPETVYSVEVSGEEEDKKNILFRYADNDADIEAVADIFGIEPDSNLDKILNELREEYQLLDINFPGLEQFTNLEEYPTLRQLIERYKDRINVLVY